MTSVYVPNGRTPDDPHYAYKLRWLDKLRDAVAAGDVATSVVCGDMNIAPADADLYDPDAYIGSTHVTVPERDALRELEALGLVDVVRRRWPDRERVFTYWDYRAGMFHQDLGMRIDLVLAGPAVADRVAAAWVDRLARKGSGPSDHAPVMVDLDEAPDGDIGPVVPAGQRPGGAPPGQRVRSDQAAAQGAGAAPADLVQRDPGGHAGVQRLHRAADRDGGHRVAGLADQPGQAGVLAAHHQHQRSGRARPPRSMSTSASPSSPTRANPASAYARRVRLRLVARAIGSRAAAPAEVFHAAAVIPAARRSGMSTPWAPKAAAERTIAPRLRGSITPSRATISGSVSAVERGGQQVVGVGVRRRPAAAGPRPGAPPRRSAGPARPG